MLVKVVLNGPESERESAGIQDPSPLVELILSWKRTVRPGLHHEHFLVYDKQTPFEGTALEETFELEPQRTPLDSCGRFL